MNETEFSSFFLASECPVLDGTEQASLLAHSQNTQLIFLSTDRLLSIMTTPDFIAQHS